MNLRINSHLFILIKRSIMTIQDNTYSITHPLITWGILLHLTSLVIFLLTIWVILTLLLPLCIMGTLTEVLVIVAIAKSHVSLTTISIGNLSRVTLVSGRKKLING